MRTPLIAIAIAIAIASAGAGVAQADHTAHHPAGAAAVPAKPPAQAAPGDRAAAMHERCMGMMGAAMDQAKPHDQDRSHPGAPTMPNGKSLSTAEQMHQRCAAMMKTAEAPTTPNGAR